MPVANRGPLVIAPGCARRDTQSARKPADPAGQLGTGNPSFLATSPCRASKVKKGRSRRRFVPAIASAAATCQRSAPRSAPARRASSHSLRSEPEG